MNEEKMSPLWIAFAERFNAEHGFDPNPRDKFHLWQFQCYKWGAESGIPKEAPDPNPTVFGAGILHWREISELLYPHYKGTQHEPVMTGLFGYIRKQLDDKKKGSL